MNRFLLLSLFAACAILIGCQTNAPNINTGQDLEAALQALSSGDTLFIPPGEYKDVELHISVKSTSDQMVLVEVTDPASTTFTGTSRLYLSGSFVEVSGFNFTNGYVEKGSVISFRSKDKKAFAENCRLSHCAVQEYTNPDRLHSDHWIEIAGRENRFDHNYIGGKLNIGATCVVRLDAPYGTNNRNSIDSNYFAPKVRMGSNGGETFRIGTSANSLKTSGAKIINNFFDQCSGEVEIASIKSSDNTVSGNVFYECEGVLALRHGNRNELANNYFIGNNKMATGGIRVINAGHNIHDNYFCGLKGKRFFSAFPLMNGVPNSAINRYHQVKNVEITRNLFINCDQIAFGVGSDNERTATPANTSFSENLLYFENPDQQVGVLTDISGITFEGNVSNNKQGLTGFAQTELTLEKTDEGLDYVLGYAAPKLPIQRSKTGPAWLNKKGPVASHEKPTLKRITPDDVEQINALLASASIGDTIAFQGGEVYNLSESIQIDKNLVFISEGEGSTTLQPGTSLIGSGLIEIFDGAHVDVYNFKFIGRSEFGDATNGVRSRAPMVKHFNLRMYQCSFEEFNESRFAGIAADKGTFADTVRIQDCHFERFSGFGLALNSESENRGRYNAEFVYITDCSFTNMMGPAIDVYRGGNDESTLGPFVWIEGCSFDNVCNRELGSAVRMIGVQYARVNDCSFQNSGMSGRALMFEDPRWADISITNCVLAQSGRIQTFYDDRVDWETVELVKP